MGCGASAAAVPFTATVTGPVVKGDGTSLDAAVVYGGKIKLVLFSANVPGDQTTNFVQFRLLPLYNALKAKQQNFEVLFVSEDHDQQAFDDYLRTMPWFAIPYSDTQRRSGLKYVLGAQGPSLIVVDENDELITTEGMKEVMQDPQGAKFPWKTNKMEGMMDALGDME